MVIVRRGMMMMITVATGTGGVGMTIGEGIGTVIRGSVSGTRGTRGIATIGDERRGDELERRDGVIFIMRGHFGTLGFMRHAIR